MPTLIHVFDLWKQYDPIDQQNSAALRGVNLDIQAGEIIALYSSPSYDPNVLTLGKDWQTIEKLLTAGDQPLFNRVIAGRYPPGSTFKLVTASAGLSEEKITKIQTSTKKKIVLPIDLKIKTGQGIKNVLKEDLNQYKNFRILDIGSATIEIFAKYLRSAKMIVWNGPMGLFEEKPFEQGTNKLLREILKNKKAKIVIGGGETIICLKMIGPNRKLPQNIFISTGGGAMLEFLSGKTLPGIEPLIINHK